MSVIKVSSDELPAMIRQLAPQLDDDQVKSLTVKSPNKPFFGPGTLVRGTAHKYMFADCLGGKSTIYRVATYPTCSTPFDDEVADVKRATDYESPERLNTTVDIRGAFRVMLVRGGTPGQSTRTIGVGLRQSYEELRYEELFVSGYQPQRYDDNIVAVTFKAHEIDELVGSQSSTESKVLFFYCAACGAVANKSTCQACGTERGQHSVFVGGHMPLTPTVVWAIEQSGHKFVRNPLLAYMQDMKNWAEDYLRQNADKVDQPRRCIKL